MVLRWWRNRMGRPHSPPQIHWKIIWTLSKYNKTPLNAGRGHQAPRKAAQSLLKEAGQNIKDKKTDKRVRNRVVKEEKVCKHQETLSPAGLWGILESQTNHNSQWRSSPDALICHQKAGTEVSTRPECPEGNLRELTWDSNTNCGIARERERERERELSRKKL